MRKGSTESLDDAVAPVRELVVKLHERCNIACDHCYMYEAADQGWRRRPTRMADETVDRAAFRLGEHARRHRLGSVRVVFHGGEPLLAGPATIERAMLSFRAALPPGSRVSFAVQTNGILLDERFLDLFRRFDVGVGVSLDGDRAANDRHRRYATGRSSYTSTVAGIQALRSARNRRIYRGLLCTVDLRNDPVRTFEALLDHEPPRIDFLLPHGNWAHPPPGLDPEVGDDRPTPYADWLISVFDRWYDARPPETGIRMFESIMSLLLGGTSRTEVLGLAAPAAVVVESDGTFEGSDALKTTGPAGGSTGLSVFADSLDDVLRHPVVAGARRGLAGLDAQCRRCPVVDVCGGGLYAHRYAPDGTFTHPSVYSGDLRRLIEHIQGRLTADLRASAARVSG
ncbi:FxsB family cyclophane-forming radical SAM/SPASM peptide maturase [Plantactinospora endophytica]|uniref:Radical SAM protein n=1 Tax=Plantactinospora endophytica TaxID=673535 RepID=A0ABQ4E1E3_9ACTN|nr:FxsB family cyclophane-forming radical SAM/SPASM peptide maturase [Plantactinospora endophytica]GIG88540.1 radical SAM protein [Plantactinospora endophytica]